MRNPAGKLADQVELLGMPKRCFRLAAIGDLVGEASVPRKPIDDEQLLAEVRRALATG